jgi:signal transduction histidine kinase/DNA-binding response OmpR family regulator/ligand-binding sensor domain-containing protein
MTFSSTQQLAGAHSVIRPITPFRRLHVLPLAALFCSLVTGIAHTQESLLPVFHFKRLTQADGLSSDAIGCNVVRDKKGYVWIANARGLDRFDGYSVKKYRNYPGDRRSLPSDAAFSLLMDSRDRLWVGTYGAGLSIYDPSTDIFANPNPTTYHSAVGHLLAIYAIREDRSGNLWLGTEGSGVVHVEVPNQTPGMSLDSLARNLRLTTYNLGTKGNTAYDLCVWSDGRVFVGSDSGIVLIDSPKRSISRFTLVDRVARLLNSTFISNISPDGSGNLWVGTRTEGLFLFDPRSNTVRNYRHNENDLRSIPSNEVYDVLREAGRNLWVSTSKGIVAFDPSTGRIVPYLSAEKGPQESLGWRISLDKTGTLWFATQNQGLYYLTNRSRRFPLFSIPDAHGSPKAFEGINRDKHGNFWVTSRGEVMKIDFARSSVLNRTRVYPEEYNPYYDNNSSILDTYGNLWMGSKEHGLYRVDLPTTRTRQYLYTSHTFNSPGVKSIAPSGNDALWIGRLDQPLMRFEFATGVFTPVPEVSTMDALHVMTARDGTLWIAAEIHGLVHFNPMDRSSTLYINNPSDIHSLSAGWVGRSYEDPDGGIWANGGTVMNQWDRSTQTFRRFPNPAGLAADNVYPLGMDSRHRLWIGSERCTSVMHPSDGRYENFDAWGDLCGTPVDIDSLSDGSLIMTGSLGINIFSADSLTVRREPPPLSIAGMTINDSTAVPLPLENVWGELTLSYSQNVVGFEFVATDLASPLLVKYHCQLEGLDNDWVDPGDRRYVRYAGLQPGTYVFRVKATSARDEWPEQQVSLAITIAPPWWRSWWAYGGYALFMFAILSLAYRARLKQIGLRQKAEMEHFQAEHLAEVDRLKSRFFANISHEFRTPLTLILGPTDQLLETTRDSSERQKLGLIQDNAKKLLALVSQLLDFSRLESGVMRLQVSSGDVVRFLRRIVLSFESWAERKQIRLSFQSDAESLQGVFDADKLEKIVNNLMSNATKYTPDGGAVDVSCCTEVSTSPPGPRRLQISVWNTGPGIMPEQIDHIFERFYRGDHTHGTEGTGIGLALTKELVELHHGTITVRSTPGEGTVFLVTIPIERSEYLLEETVESASAVEESDHLEPKAPEEKEVPVPPIQDPKGKPIALVVEDNTELRAYIREYLESDYVVHESENGRTGLERAVEIIPDIVITDVMMPEMDGIELCRTLKQDVRTSHVPVILLTARADTQSKIDGLEVGADDYVAKPFDSRELAARVWNLIEQRRQLRKKFSAGVVLRPGEVSVSSIDDTLLKKMLDTVEKNMGNENFGVDDLAEGACLSRTHLNRKVHALVNLSPAEFIRYLRLERARELLEKNVGSIAEIADQVGFRNQSHFSASFKERFGVLPSEIRRHEQH